MQDGDSVIQFLLLMAVPILTGYLASRKGYSFFLWVFAGGCLGLITLAFLPYANDSADPEEERRRLRKRGNTIGAVFAGLTALILLVGKFAKG